MIRGLQFLRGRLCLRMSAGLLTLLVSTVASAGVGMWTTHGPPGGSSNPVIVDQGTGAMYVGGSTGFFTTGLFKSTDSGATWQTLNLQAIPLAAGPAGTVYAASVVFSDLGRFGGTLYVSSDGGADWRVLAQRPETRFGLTIDPFTATTLYRLDTTTTLTHPPFLFGTLSRSTDAGATWSEIDQSLGLSFGYISAFAPDPRTRGTFYAATSGSAYFQPVPAAIYKTTDGGSSWTLLENTILGTVVTLAVDPFTPSTLYAGVVTSLYSGGSTGTFKSDDGGSTFRSVNSFSPTQAVMDPNHPNRIYLATSGQGVQTSTDGGVTWVPMNTSLTDLTVFGLTLAAGGTSLHAATASGVFDYQIPLTLNAAHGFTITLAATDQRTGRTGPGVATRINDIFGYFSIPAITGNPSNPEVFVKVLNGIGVNGRYWFFYGGLTDLEYTLTVTEDATGLTKTYTKAAGSACGGFDTEAFTP